MSTAVIDDIDLDWVTFSEIENEKICERKVVDCPHVAVYRVWWGPSYIVPGKEDRCGGSSLLCISCYEHLTSIEGLVACHRCFQELDDHFFKRPVYVEFIR